MLNQARCIHPLLAQPHHHSRPCMHALPYRPQMVRIPEYEEVLAWAKEMDKQVADRRIAGLGGRVAEVCCVWFVDIYGVCRGRGR